MGFYGTSVSQSIIQHALVFLPCKIWYDFQVELESGIQHLAEISSGQNAIDLGEYLLSKSFTQLVAKLRQVRNSSQAQNLRALGFPGGTVVKKPPANAGDTGSNPGPGRSQMLRSN